MAKSLGSSTLIVGVLLGVLASYLVPRLDFKLWLPLALLFSPFRSYNEQLWKEVAKVNEKIVYPPTPVPEIQAKDFSFDTIKQASDNFRYPVVVRGLFANTTAVRMWKTADYLPKRFDGYQIPIVRDARVGTLQDDRVVVDFADAFQAMHTSSHSTQYLFFPVKSRFTFNGSAAGSAGNLQEACDRICAEDLDLDRIWRGFGSKQHKTFAGTQFVIGKSTEEFTRNTTGSDWHCAVGNNWFIQASGRKLWHFIEPRYSAWMHPLKGGLFNMWTSNKDMHRLQKHLPTRTVILEEGDMVYNPDWTWHKVENFGGLSIGIPIRERNLTLAFQNNWYFSSIVATNVVLHKFGLSLGGLPPPSQATEADN